MKLDKILTTLAVASLFLIPQATAQVLESGTVSDVRISVMTTDDRDEIAQISPGETVEVSGTTEVVLRVIAPRGAGPGNQRHYLPASWSQASGHRQVGLSEVKQDRGSCVVSGRAGGSGQFVYELRGVNATQPSLAKNSVSVRFVGTATAPARPAPGGGVQTTRAEDMVERLFRGIVMRDPHPDRSRPFVADIAQGGYPSVVDVAYQIVESRESQVDMRQKGYDNQDRLRAIYRYLLNLDEDEIDQYQWNDHLRMMRSENVTGVVMDIVRSPEFRRVHGYQDSR